MKIILLLVAAASLLLAGCGDQSNPSAQTTNATTSGNPLTAPVDYLEAVGKAKQSAIKTVDVTSLNQAIQMFHVDNGRFPKDLNELVTEKIMPKIPDAPYGMKIEYDANSGKVKVVKK
jgi:outer membrane murein-binding lipoprotein Lpp